MKCIRQKVLPEVGEKQPPEKSVLRKKVFLENSQDHPCSLRPADLLKKRLWHKCFPVNFVKFLRITFLRTPASARVKSFADSL